MIASCLIISFTVRNILSLLLIDYAADKTGRKSSTTFNHAISCFDDALCARFQCDLLKLFGSKKCQSYVSLNVSFVGSPITYHPLPPVFWPVVDSYVALKLDQCLRRFKNTCLRICNRLSCFCCAVPKISRSSQSRALTSIDADCPRAVPRSNAEPCYRKKRHCCCFLNKRKPTVPGIETKRHCLCILVDGVYMMMMFTSTNYTILCVCVCVCVLFISRCKNLRDTSFSNLVRLRSVRRICYLSATLIYA